jgi:hypothetical protein
MTPGSDSAAPRHQTIKRSRSNSVASAAVSRGSPTPAARPDGTSPRKTHTIPSAPGTSASS